MLNKLDTANTPITITNTIAVRPIVQSYGVISNPTQSELVIKETPKETHFTGNEVFINAYKTAPWSHFLSVKNITYQSNQKEKSIYKLSLKDTLITEKVEPNKISLHTNDKRNSENNTILILLLAAFILIAWVKVSFG